MSRDEALTAVLNAARVLRAVCPLDAARPYGITAPLVQLYAALDAVDAVGDARERTPGLCAEQECWDYRWMGGPYCFVHRALPSLRRRDAALEVRDG